VGAGLDEKFAHDATTRDARSAQVIDTIDP
jgi:hypothetical protein